ncbi:RND family transporter [Parasegetibacter sp. NRK P23]|uniref:efflux RND transporter permease subunit n=1 Tax=Parasegetibacter sp. NRK P23 TaxID=2942999 RepID=UPI002044C012|nr:MMPL family transporter [Parasegetibacter sp. NRK P23]MCM5529507.1 MMPL family transporter [Parasegetibacter sp. NRK P23]
MWLKLGKGLLRYRIVLLILLAAGTAFMGYRASKVQLSYEFTRAIPTDNPRYQDYQDFRATFGEDGNMMVIGLQKNTFFEPSFFNDYRALQQKLRKINGVEGILSVPDAVNLVKDTKTNKLKAVPIFSGEMLSAQKLDSAATVFQGLPFYKGILYNPSDHTYLMGLRINRDVVASKKRNDVIAAITAETAAFGKKHQTEMMLSGLPYIRTVVGLRIQEEMRFFLIGSLVLSALILLVFFRSFSAMVLSLAVVLIGVVWSMGTMDLFGYKISLLTALIPPLIVVIGIPNCIYFLNKYHTAYRETGEKNSAMVQMIAKMGVVTLFCNIAAAIGFAVFALTRSEILREFGVVAGINIMVIFLISLVLIPGALSFLPAPKRRHTRYLDNNWLNGLLTRLQRWALHRRRFIYAYTALIVLVALVGIFKLRSEGFIVDDLPKQDKIYTDLKFFEKHFEGIMPLEIVIDSKKKNGFAGMRALSIFEKMDSLAMYLGARPDMARPLYLGEGLKFARQAFYEGDSLSYALPNSFDGAFVAEYLRPQKGGSGNDNTFAKLLSSFMDSTRRQARMSVQMADIGSSALPLVLDSARLRAEQLFDTAQYQVKFTGTSVTFLEGSSFIIDGLKESIFWAFLLIALCMLYLFRSLRILICSLVPNIIPLLVTAGVMGWAGVPLKPSTVLIFSVALGIAIDVTIRFLVNYKQELPLHGENEHKTVVETIRHTGISIIYTSLVLIAGFVIFCFSSFGGTLALGWLTGLTLIVATVTNLVLLPALLISTSKEAM